MIKSRLNSAAPMHVLEGGGGVDYLAIAVDEVLEVILLGKHCLCDDGVKINTYCWYEWGLVSLGQPCHFLRLLIVGVG